MQATQIGTAETPSAARLPVSLATYTSPAPQSFDLTWQREMGISATDSAARIGVAQSPTSGDAPASRTAQDEVGFPQLTKQSSSVSSAEDAASIPDASKTNGSAVAKAASRFVGSQVGAQAKNPVAPDVRFVAATALPAESQTTKRTPQAPVSENATAATQPSVEPNSLTAVLALSCIQESSATTAPQPVIAQNPAEASNRTIKSTAAKRDRPSTAGATEKVTNPLPAEKGATAIATLDSGSKPVSTPLAATQGAGGSGSHANSDAALSGSLSSSTGLQPSVTGMAGNTAQTGAANHSPSSAFGTGARLDATLPTGQLGVQSHQVLASGPAQLDVGVFDGTHGWLRVRAELGADGAVSASLTASASAHESLRAVLPEMANYLESEAVNVSRIAIHRAAEAAPTMAPNAGEGHGTGDAQPQRQDGQQSPKDAFAPGRDSSQEEQREAVPATAPTGLVSGQTNGAAGPWTGGAPGAGSWLGGLPHALYGFGFPAGSSGSWLNVCA